MKDLSLLVIIIIILICISLNIDMNSSEKIFDGSNITTDVLCQEVNMNTKVDEKINCKQP
ncbi:hypothetical protein [Colwellia sp. 12G3]|uniref:hypothetical protein n=1 Tax=Colwellia sp. 12G3 TaxID=2058299 RepID=UPI000C33FD2D|nr:hypothetical protein [Colwellia sp. 12G3]PKI16777.1 hypothetical protein CXF71_05845 [Colwellia sp. 12G3]